MWTLTTPPGDFPLLIIEMDVVVTVMASLVTKCVVVWLVTIMDITVTLPSSAYIIFCGRASKQVSVASWRNAINMTTAYINRAIRNQNEGSVEVPVVVFYLIVVGQA